MTQATKDATTYQIKYGNREGKYFTQWRFDLLEELIRYVHSGPVPSVSKVLPVEDVEIFYDPECDFHHLTFKAGGKSVNVRFYKVFSCAIDGEDGWRGCPRSLIWEYSLSLRKICGVIQ